LRSPLYPFLELYYEVAQYLNDVGDYPADLASGQPNLVALCRAQAGAEPACQPLGDALDDPRDDPSGAPADRELESFLVENYLSLARMAAQLPAVERGVAQLKLHESLTQARKLGVLRQPTTAGEPSKRPAGAPRLFWYAGAPG